jgi:hypothetical protein
MFVGIKPRKEAFEKFEDPDQDAGRHDAVLVAKSRRKKKRSRAQNVKSGLSSDGLEPKFMCSALLASKRSSKISAAERSRLTR